MEKIEHKTVSTNGINMHVASIGSGPVVLFLHGFPELWYTWRHQLLSLSAAGYRAIAPDLRGYGDTDAPPDASSHSILHIVADLVGLLDALGIEPDRVKALVNLSVVFRPRNPKRKPIQSLRAIMGDNYLYVQKPGEVEEEFARAGAARIIKTFLASRDPQPPLVPKEIGFGGSPNLVLIYRRLGDVKIPHLLDGIRLRQSLPYQLIFLGLSYTLNLNSKSEEVTDVICDANLRWKIKRDKKKMRTWELTAAWTGVQIKVPVKFIVGDLDITYNTSGVKEYIHNGGFKRDVRFLQELIVMEGVAHFINQERPEEISAHIYDFIKKF
ncbi:Epoxide hydrolase A isoform A [Glycine soja]|uniref:Epoxide hydrolase A isoform A n=1 Tax=Glycine soja TaxID=3848 RepID=A0A445LF55_GLYSO|nr:Epoxide hydrolase A isoform A [Glycine soja]